MKDWMAIHTFLSEDAKAQHLSAKGKVKTEREWSEYAMSLEKAKCVQEWCGYEEFFFCHWRAETEDGPKKLCHLVSAVGAAGGGLFAFSDAKWAPAAALVKS